jgi:hypothetical protein
MFVGRDSRILTTDDAGGSRSAMVYSVFAPGAVFRPHLERSAWMRFNVTACEDTRVQDWLRRLASSAAA